MTLSRTVLTLLAGLTAVSLPMAFAYGGVPGVLGLTGGVGWALANYWVWQGLSSAWLRGERRASRWGAWFLLKVPLLYLLAGILIVHPASSPVGFLVGATCWFAAIWLAAVRTALA